MIIAMVNANNSICHVLAIIDGSTEEILDVVTLADFNLAAFQAQFDVPIELDPEMHDRYVVGPDDVSFLKQYLTVPVSFNFTTTGSWIEAARIA